MIAAPPAAPSLRLDKLLWHLRFAKSRSVAHAMVERGHIRLNGRRVEKASAAVRAGDVLTLPLGEEVRVIRLRTLPARRGPPREAQACYEQI